MEAKRVLKTILCGAFAFVLAAFGGVLINKAPAKASAESSPIVSLYTPTAADAGYTVSGFGDWKQTTTVEAYADSPTGSVLHHTIDNTESAGGETWPSFTVKIPASGEVTDFAGYIVWLEYTGEVYSDSNYWGLFNFYMGGQTVSISKPITFIDENGKINETKTGGWCYHRNNMTAIEDTEYTSAYSYSFKGYMIVPSETFEKDATPTADSVMKLSHDYRKTITADIKIGSIGYYTDYDAVLNELGRCTYSFVDHDGSVVKTETVKPNTTVVAPEYKNTFSQGNNVYTLVGWSGYIEGMTISTDLVFNASYKVIDFHMVKGASIRTTAGSAGIRFIAEFDEALYNEVSLSDNKQFGMLITKLDYYTQALSKNDDLIAGLDSIGENKYVLITESSTNPVKPYAYVEQTNTTYRINGAITNIQYSHADWKWIGVGVVITENGGETEYLYSAHTVEDSARTAAFVASSALNDPTGDYDETETEVLKNYVYETAAKLSGVSEAEFNGSADKAGYISAYSLELGDGFDTSMKFNKNVEGKEAYLTIGESKTIEAAVVNANGDSLDVACSVSVGETDALQVNGTKVTALKNGYAEVTVTCDLFGYSEKVTVYTGSTDAGNRANSYKGSNVNASKAQAESGEIDGIPYYWMQYQTKDSAHIFAHYSDMSVYYVDYLISQGYKYLRIPFYFDTTRYEEFGVTAEEVSTSPYITIWMANGFIGTSDGKSKHIDVPVNEWCYYDMDINHYRMNYVEATGEGVDTYGKKLTASSYYQYLNMKFCGAYIAVYTSDMTFVKSSGLSIDESNDEIAFGEDVNLAEWYGTDDTAVFTVDGVKMNEMTAIKAEHKITIGANVYTAKLGNGTFKDEEGNYLLGSENASVWSIDYKTVETVEKTMTVKDGLELGDVALVDLKDSTGSVSLSAYTAGDALKELGFEVTHSYVKRYSDGTAQAAETVANSERGIFYVTVSGTKGAQKFSYDVTLDFYNSTEAVEYETFGHADSKYAVKLYYYTSGALTSKSYDYLVENYPAEDGKGMAMSVGDDYVSLKAYGDHTLDTSNSNAATVYGEDYLSSVYYVAIDQSKISPEAPLVHVIGNGTMAINVYVTPRHSKEYYEEFAKSNTGVLKYSYAAGWSNGQSKRYSLQDIENGVATVTYKDAWSANWQSWAYDNQNITLSNIVDNYDTLCSNLYPMYISEDPHGRTETDLNNGVAKLGSLIF